MVEQKVRSKEGFFFKIAEETAYLYADRKDPGVREELTV